MAELLEIRNLKTSFYTAGGEVQAVRGVSLSVGQGESVGVVGESGSGKSVTFLSVLRLLASNARIKEGEILFEGRDLARMPKKGLRAIRGGSISMIFQDPMSSLNPLIPVGEQVSEYAAFGYLQTGFRTLDQIAQVHTLGPNHWNRPLDLPAIQSIRVTAKMGEVPEVRRI